MVATPNSVFTNFIFLVRRSVAILVVTKAIGDQRNLPISKVKQGNSRLGELNL